MRRATLRGRGPAAAWAIWRGGDAAAAGGDAGTCIGGGGADGAVAPCGGELSREKRPAARGEAVAAGAAAAAAAAGGWKQASSGESYCSWRRLCFGPSSAKPTVAGRPAPASGWGAISREKAAADPSEGTGFFARGFGTGSLASNSGDIAGRVEAEGFWTSAGATVEYKVSGARPACQLE